MARKAGDHEKILLIDFSILSIQARLLAGFLITKAPFQIFMIFASISCHQIPISAGS